MPYTQSASTFNMQNLMLANTQQCGINTNLRNNVFLSATLSAEPVQLHVETKT